MKCVRDKLVSLRVALSELRYVVQEALILITKLALLVGALSAPVQWLTSYIDQYNECHHKRWSHDSDCPERGARRERFGCPHDEGCKHFNSRYESEDDEFSDPDDCMKHSTDNSTQSESEE